MKEKIRKVFFDINSRWFKITNDFLTVVTIVSIISIALSTIQDLDKYKIIFKFVEFFSVAVFTIEYLLRIYISKNKINYILSFFGITDLLAILPSFLGLANLTFLKSIRTLRILRFLRMLRFAKILKYSKDNAKNQKNNDIDSRYILLTLEMYLIILLSVTFLSGTLMWLVEGFRVEFKNIPIAMIWSIKVLMGGVPQYHPETIWGEFIVIFTRFFGLVLFGLLIGLISKITKKILLQSDQ